MGKREDNSLKSSKSISNTLRGIVNYSRELTLKYALSCNKVTTPQIESKFRETDFCQNEILI